MSDDGLAAVVTMALLSSPDISRYDIDLICSSVLGYHPMNFSLTMGLLPGTQNCGLRMRRECRERFPRHRLQRKPLVSDPDMHHGTCVAHVPWCMSGSLTRGGGENVPGILGACATHNFAYLVRGPWHCLCMISGLLLSSKADINCLGYLSVEKWNTCSCFLQ